MVEQQYNAEQWLDAVLLLMADGLLAFKRARLQQSMIFEIRADLFGRTHHPRP